MLYQKCNYHNGDEALYYKDNNNCAFIDSKGTISVTVNGYNTNFTVSYCPKCGHNFMLDSIKVGTHFYYVDDTMLTPDEIIEGIVDEVYPNNYFEARYLNVDEDAKYEAVKIYQWGVFFFPDKESAIRQLNNFLNGNFVYDN